MRTATVERKTRETEIAVSLDQAGPGEGGPSTWRALWVSALALLATLVLIALIAMITWSNRARDAAIGWERRSAEITILTRNIDATIARSEAALGRYVIDWRQFSTELPHRDGGEPALPVPDAIEPRLRAGARASRPPRLA